MVHCIKVIKVNHQVIQSTSTVSRL